MPDPFSVTRARRAALAAVGSALLLGACVRGGGGGGFPAPTRVPRPAPAEVEHTLFLIGDAGAPHDPTEPVLEALKRQLRVVKTPTTVVFLGDNIYPRGLPDTNAIVVPTREETERRLLAQIEVAVSTRTPTYFIPGNHDWAYMTEDGWDAIRRQETFIREHGAPYAQLQPTGGCPGPVYVDLGRRLRLLMIDTQWWLHDYDRPRHPESKCPTDSPAEVVNAMNRAMLRVSRGRHVVVVGHHPLASGGLHGGHLGLREHLFPLRSISRWLYVPLPVVGSYYALNRQQGASNQDLAGPKNQRMRRALEVVFSRRHPLVYAAGHDHDLQVMEGRTARYILVSGAGVYNHVTDTHYRANTIYAAARSGFMRLDFLRDGRVRLGVELVDGESAVTESHSMYLKH